MAKITKEESAETEKVMPSISVMSKKRFHEISERQRKGRRNVVSIM
jgi:hypothetical protein